MDNLCVTSSGKRYATDFFIRLIQCPQWLTASIAMSTFQLPLNITLRDEAVFDNFVLSENALLITILKNFVHNKTEPFIYCYGDAGVGKTHLLQACCHAGTEIFYLPLSNYNTLSPTIFDLLEYQHIVCIDDIDAIIGNHEWEESLFYFYNRARDQNVSLLMSAKRPPQQLSCMLPDLQSRLSSALILEIKNLTDEEKKHALQLRAKSRGLHLSEESSYYLIHHYSRNMRDLFAVLAQLDQASLVTKRKITIPFIKFAMQNTAFCAKLPTI